jgi:hypothetical protein
MALERYALQSGPGRDLVKMTCWRPAVPGRLRRLRMARLAKIHSRSRGGAAHPGTGSVTGGWGTYTACALSS